MFLGGLNRLQFIKADLLLFRLTCVRDLENEPFSSETSPRRPCNFLLFRNFTLTTEPPGLFELALSGRMQSRSLPVDEPVETNFLSCRLGLVEPPKLMPTTWKVSLA